MTEKLLTGTLSLNTTNNILVLLAKPDSGELRWPATALIILAGKKDMHKISDKFEFWPGQTTDYEVSCPWASKKFPIEL